MKFKQANTYTIQCMGQGISLKSWRNNPWFKPWFNISLDTQLLNCVCHSIRSMFRVLGIIYKFGRTLTYTAIRNNLTYHCYWDNDDQKDSEIVQAFIWEKNWPILTYYVKLTSTRPIQKHNGICKLNLSHI